MSGPKADCISESALRARFEANRASIADICARFSVLRGEAARLNERCLRLLIPGCDPFSGEEVTLDGIRKEHDLANTEASLSSARNVLAEIERATAGLRESISRREAELENLYEKTCSRLDRLKREFRSLQNAASAFDAHGSLAAGAAAIVRELASELHMENAPPLSLDPEGIKRLEHASRSVIEAEERIRAAKEAILTLLDREVLDRALSGREEQRRGRLENLRTRISSKTAPPPQEAFDFQLDLRLSKVEAKVRYHLDQGFSGAVCARINQARNEVEETRKRTLVDAAEIAYSTAVKEMSRHRAWLSRIDEIEARLVAEDSGPETDEALRMARELRRTRSLTPLDELESRTTRALTLAAQRRMAKQRRKAVWDALCAIGYEPVEHPVSRSMIFRKPGQDEFGVAVASDAACGTAQMQVVRLRDGGLGGGVLRRDREVEQETAFCEDYQRFEDIMVAQGFDLRSIKHFPPGQVPVADYSTASTESPAATARRQASQQQRRQP